METDISFPRISDSQNQSGGRQALTFENAGKTTRRKIGDTLRKGNSASCLAYTASLSFREEKNEPAAKLLKVISEDPAKCKDIHKAYKASKTENALQRQSSASPESSLSLLVDGDFSKSQFQLIRNFCISHNSNILSPYNDIREAKEATIPPKSDILITECSAEVDLQACVDHDTKRLFMFLSSPEEMKAIENLPDNAELTFHHKWGFDESGNHNRYQQNFSDSRLNAGEHLLLTALSPLQLVHSDVIVWKNPTPNSVQFCKPIRIQFKNTPRR